MTTTRLPKGKKAPNPNAPALPVPCLLPPAPLCTAGAARGKGGEGGSLATPVRRRTDLPELQGGDDHEDEAPEAEAGPIPVRQAGIGLALQEL